MRLEDGFLAQATRQPDALAVVDGDNCRTYAELHAQAARLAGAMEHLTTTGPTRVGVCVERGADAYAAVLGVLLAGAAYVPIAPHHPVARVQRIIAAAELDLIIADTAGLATLHSMIDTLDLPPILAPAHYSGGIISCGRSELARAVPRQVARDAKGGDPLAYLLFTSGSTGEPKGVPITHANVTSFLTENAQHYRFVATDRFSQTFELTFDLSVFDMFMAWGAGACLYPLCSTDLLDPVSFVQQHELSVWFSVPSVGAMLRQRGGLAANVMPSLRYSLFCGEALTGEVAAAWSAAAPESSVENLYGPTELTIACTRQVWQAFTVSQTMHGILPIGQPFSNMRAVLLDAQGECVANGQVGELCLAGAQQFSGYWRQPELTDARMSIVDGVRYYRTGDRAVWRDGLLHFVGRLDNQLQVSGHRVELGDVDSALRSIPDVIDAVTFGMPPGQPSVSGLGAAVSLVEGSTMNARSVRRTVAALIPAYMRPRQVEVIERFPLNVNGKIDRRAMLQHLTTVGP